MNDLSDSRSLDAEGFVPINESALNTAVFSDSRIFTGSMISPHPDQNLFVVSSAKVSFRVICFSIAASFKTQV